MHPGGGEAKTTTKELSERIDALEAKARKAEDWVDIANLQAAYGYYVDKGLWDKAADLFARDGTLEIARRGVHVGQERVRQYLHELPKYEDGAVFNHMQLQPVIHIDPDGKHAKARWRTLIMIGWVGKEGRWGEATYENTYVRENGKWRIASLHGIINFYCEYDEGWHRGGVALLRSTKGLEPDRPQTFEYEAHPKAVIAPFHYDEV